MKRVALARLQIVRANLNQPLHCPWSLKRGGSSNPGDPVAGPNPEHPVEPLDFLKAMTGLSLDEFNPVRGPRGESAVQDDFHGEAGELDVPRFNQGVQ